MSKIKNGGLDQYGADPFEQQQFGTAGAEGVNVQYNDVEAEAVCKRACVSAGSQRSEVICVEKEAGIVEEQFCNASTKPDDMFKSCNDHQCPARQ